MLYTQMTVSYHSMSDHWFPLSLPRHQKGERLPPCLTCDPYGHFVRRAAEANGLPRKISRDTWAHLVPANRQVHKVVGYKSAHNERVSRFEWLTPHGQLLYFTGQAVGLEPRHQPHDAQSLR